MPTTDQVVAAIAAAYRRDATFGTFVRLAAATGARRGELCALKWGAIDLDRGTLRIDASAYVEPGVGVLTKATKNHSVRDVSLDTETVEPDARSGSRRSSRHRAHVDHRAPEPQVPRRGTCKGACPGEADPTTRGWRFNDAFNDAAGRVQRTCRSAPHGPATATRARRPNRWAGCYAHETCHRPKPPAASCRPPNRTARRSTANGSVATHIEPSAPAPCGRGVLRALYTLVDGCHGLRGSRLCISGGAGAM